VPDSILVVCFIKGHTNYGTSDRNTKNMVLLSKVANIFFVCRVQFYPSLPTPNTDHIFYHLFAFWQNFLILDRNLLFWTFFIVFVLNFFIVAKFHHFYCETCFTMFPISSKISWNTKLISLTKNSVTGLQ
jgi:hypothetical protein